MEPRNPEREARQAQAMREALARIDAEDAAKAKSQQASIKPKPKPKPKPGWYPYPKMVDTQRYWDGEKWTDQYAPLEREPQRTADVSSGGEPSRQPPIVIAAILAGSVIGLIMSMQSTTVIAGSGTIWTGAAIAAGASVAANWVLKKGLPTSVRVIAAGCAAIALISAFYVESQLEERRQEISRIVQ